MSRQLLSRSPDLQRLVDEGFEVRFESSMLLMSVPYVTSSLDVARGWIVSSVTANGDRTGPPDDHTVHFVGATGDAADQPCDSNGQPLLALMNVTEGPIQVATDLVASCQFSQKPPSGSYPDYYEKMTTYGAILLSEVHAIDSTVKIPTFAPMATEETESVHRYFDSATSRARIGAVSDRAKGQRVAIVGVGGTGSYVLDALVKTHVAEIHLYDGDTMGAHNAFRAPGAMSLEELKVAPRKVDHHQRVYDALHRHVIPHPVHVDERNVEELRGLDFIFVCVDAGPMKRVLFDKLSEFGVPFVDTGMGIDQTGDSLGGILRTTRLVPGQGAQEWVQENLSFAEAEDDEYDQNIQIVELNMLNAAHAVIAWKKHIGFYRDFRHEVQSEYTIDGNLLTNSGGDVEG
jgi:ThiF family